MYNGKIVIPMQRKPMKNYTQDNSLFFLLIKIARKISEITDTKMLGEEYIPPPANFT